MSCACVDELLDVVHLDRRRLSLLQVPLAMAFYQELRGLGPHGGLAVATAMSTAGEVVLTGWSERFGVHMGAMAIQSWFEAEESQDRNSHENRFVLQFLVILSE